MQPLIVYRFSVERDFIIETGEFINREATLTMSTKRPQLIEYSECSIT